MPLTSDVQIDKSKFGPAAISQKTKDLNQKLIDIQESIPKWYEVGAQRYREMRANGETPLPVPPKLPQARKTTVPSRDTGREIPCRIIPSKHEGTARGVYYHIHGGGWVLQDVSGISQLDRSSSLTLYLFSLRKNREFARVRSVRTASADENPPSEAKIPCSSSSQITST